MSSDLLLDYTAQQHWVVRCNARGKSGSFLKSIYAHQTSISFATRPSVSGVWQRVVDVVVQDVLPLVGAAVPAVVFSAASALGLSGPFLATLRAARAAAVVLPLVTHHVIEKGEYLKHLFFFWSPQTARMMMHSSFEDRFMI